MKDEIKELNLLMHETRSKLKTREEIEDMLTILDDNYHLFEEDRYELIKNDKDKKPVEIPLDVIPDLTLVFDLQDLPPGDNMRLENINLQLIPGNELRLQIIDDAYKPFELQLEFPTLCQEDSEKD